MSYSQFLEGQAIQAGYDWALAVKIVSADLSIFPVDVQFVAHVRKDADGPLLLALDTPGGGVTRQDGTTVRLAIAGADSVDWDVGMVVLDVIRIDEGRREHLGFQLEIPVQHPVTRI